MEKIKSLVSCKNRKALITGASGHLGLEVSKALGSIGYELIIVDLDLQKLKKLSVEISSNYKVTVTPICCNLEIEYERNRLIEEIKQNFSKIDCLINNAAFVGTTNLNGWNAPFEEQNLESWRRSFEVNLTAPFHLSQEM